METVLVIPLFLAMIGGIFWIGDLMWTRQQLTIADRYTTWNYGCRYEPGGWDAGTIHARFFESSEFRRPTGVQVEKQPFDWSHRVRGQVRLTMKMPDWTRYMFNGVSVFYGGQAPEETMPMTGRSLDGRHAVVMRTKEKADPGYIRNKYGVPESGEVATQWKDIYGEKWPSD